MDHFIAEYKKRLNLEHSQFSRIDHNDAMVADVYKVTLKNGTELILKICSRDNHYFREIYFLKSFADHLPVPRIINVVPPEINLKGAILMDYLSGHLLKKEDFTDTLAREIGSLIARIHVNRMTGFGEIIEPKNLKSDPLSLFALKFQEGIDECKNHLPKPLVEKCSLYYNNHLHLLTSVDGPCLVHRDLHPGNIIVDNGNIRGIIDWASGRASFAEEDFCSLEHGEWPANESSKNAFFSGYETIKPIPDYGAIMPFLRLNRAIATIGFTVKRGTWTGSDARVYQFNRDFLEKLFQ